MKSTTSSLRRLTLAAIASALALMLVPAAIAAGTPDLQPMAAAAKALPLATSFGKGTPGENGGHFALTLKNTSHESVMVNAEIIWSVASHNRAKTIKLPAHEIKAGAEWQINDLAVEDRVVVSAAGYENLDVKVPAGVK